MELHTDGTREWGTKASNVLEFPVADTRAPNPEREPVRNAPDTEVPVPGLAHTQLFHLMATGSLPADARPAHVSTTGAAPPDAPIAVLPRKRSEFANRAVNVLIAGVTLVILAPVMILIALMVKLSSPGPVFYVQTRVGMDRRRRRTTAVFDRRQADVGGREFRIIKFRSMRVDAEAQTGAVWATQDDPRVTPIGRFLRKTRLDELPQLFNVIRGDMNIVGPRPERPSIFAHLRENIQEYPLRQRARPGITGWAQINQAYDSSLDDVRSKVRFDLEYLERQSIVEDLKIMARTLPVMLLKRGSC